MSFNKIQLTKLLIHSLKELGYDETSMTLQRESGGIQIESNLVQNLFKSIKKSYYFGITFKLLSQLPLISNINPNEVTLYQTLSHIGYFINENESTNTNSHINSIADNKNNSGNNHYIMVIDHFNKQYELFESVSKQLNIIPLDQIPSFIMSLQIMLLIQRQYFIELISINHNFNQAISFLRNVIQMYHSLYQRILSFISNSSNNITTMDQLLMEHPDLFLTNLTEFITNPKLINQLYSKQNSYQDELIKIISNIIDPDELIPTGRLITLLKQSIKYQRLTSGVNIFDSNNNNNYNNNDTNLDYSKYSLLEDNKNFHGKYNFENIKTISVNNNNDNSSSSSKDASANLNDNEIWYLQFSPNGKYLASSIADSLSDRKIVIYDVENDFQIYRILAGNNQYILYLSFSPNSQYLVACPFNENANIYYIHSKGEPISDVINTSTTINVYNNSHIPLEERLLPETIYPIDSLKIGYNHKPSTRNHETTSTSSPSSPSSSPSPILNSSSSSSSASPDITTTNSQHLSNHDSYSSKISPRVWCCDWFHTEKHENIIVFGSPDRDVIFYNFNTKKIILRMSQISPYYQSNNRNHKKDYYQRSSRHANNNDEHNDSERDEENDHNFNMDNSSNIIENANLFPRVHDLKISYDDKYLILMTHNGIIDVYDISSFPNNNLLKRNNNSTLEKFFPPRVTQLNIGKNMTCISLPAQIDTSLFEPNNGIDNFQHNMHFNLNHLVLINLQFNEIQLWDYKENILIQKFFGQRQEQFIIRSCFGYQNKVVISGSEDGKIYIWDRSNGNILNVLPGHAQNNMIPNGITANGSSNTRRKFTKNCNVVAWSPQEKDLFVSGGDDGLIKIWKITYY